MVDRRRYSPHGRFGALAAAKREGAGLPQLYRGRAAKSFKDLYETDHAESRQGGRFRWLISTCLAGTVGAISIFVVLYGSADKRESRGGFLPGLSELGEANLAGGDVPFLRNSEGLKWAAPKSDRLKITSGAVTVRYIVNEPVKQRRLGREYIHAKPYVRITGRLAPVPPDYQTKIPSFNPLSLYATQTVNPGEDSEADAPENGSVTVNVIELLGGILPDEDGQSLEDSEVLQHVAEAKEAEVEAEMIRAGAEAEGNRVAGEDGLPLGAEADGAAAPNTTVLVKPMVEDEDTLADLEGRETQVVRVGEGETLRKILQRAGADTWTARGMIESARNIFPEASLSRRPGSAHHARSLAHAPRQEGAGALQHFLGRPRSSRHGDAQRRRRVRRQQVAGNRRGDRQRGARHQRQGVDVERLRERLLRRPAAARAGRFDHEGDEGSRLADRLPPPTTSGRCGRVFLRHEGRSEGRYSAGGVALLRPSPAAEKPIVSTVFARPTGSSTTTTRRATTRSSS